MSAPAVATTAVADLSTAAVTTPLATAPSMPFPLDDAHFHIPPFHSFTRVFVSSHSIVFRAYRSPSTASAVHSPPSSSTSLLTSSPSASTHSSASAHRLASCSCAGLQQRCAQFDHCCLCRHTVQHVAIALSRV